MIMSWENSGGFFKFEKLLFREFGNLATASNGSRRRRSQWPSPAVVGPTVGFKNLTPK
mgnify:CR=1 FL=1